MAYNKVSITINLLILIYNTKVDGTFLKIANNRYDDLVVAISPDIQEDQNIVMKIQNMISEASQFLYNATRHRAYFGNVTILIPGAWNSTPSWKIATVETFEEADIRIDKQHPVYGINPYTYQPEGCGDPGKYIHLTEEYVLDKDGHGIFTWGPAGRLLVHEFSHLRYGVFDEYGLGTKEYPRFYLEDNVVYPTGCTDSIRGILYGNCTDRDPVTKLPGDNCSFVGHLDQNTAKASIMYDFAIHSNRIFKQQQAADKLIKDILPVGTEVGIVTFSSKAQTVKELTKLTTNDVRRRVSDKLPTRATGGTAIGCGLKEAKEVLQRAGKVNNGRIVLITDGEENISPMVATVKNEIITSGIRVHTLAYSADAASALRGLSQDSGGQYAYYSERARSTILDAAMEQIMKDISVCNHKVRIEVERIAKVLSPNVPVDGTSEIDRTLAKDTMFVFTFPKGVHVAVTLIAPDGSKYGNGSPEMDMDTTLNIARFNFPKAKIGRWRYTLTSSGSGTASVVVKALPGQNSVPYEIESWLSSTETDARKGKPVVVYVHVHKGYSPVINADVTVTVERPVGPSVILEPNDDGHLPDNMAEDGVYSAYFTQYSGNKRYSLDVDVKSVYGHTSYFKELNATSTTHIKGPPLFGRAQARFHNTTSVTTKALTDNFTRSISPGAMDVKGFDPAKDNFPPSRTTDLKVIAFDSEHGTVTLTWTAPGDDLDVGTASNYEIRMAQTSKQIQTNFDKQLIVNPNMVINGTLQPHVAKTKERITIQIPKGWTTVVFALRALDDSNQPSGESNFATATFKQVILLGESPEVSQIPPAKSGTDSVIIIAIVCAIIAVAIIIAVLIIVLWRQKSARKTVQLPEDPIGACMTEPNVPASNTHPIRI